MKAVTWQGKRDVRVEEVGPEVTHIAPGDRVVVPFTIACGHCWMCGQGPGGQAEYLQVPQAQAGGMADPLPLLRMGQANVRRWVGDILPLLTDDDPLRVDSFATHHLPLDDAPRGYGIFQKKQDGAVKILLRP